MSKIENLKNKFFHYNELFIYFEKVSKTLIKSFKEKKRSNIVFNRLKTQIL